MDITSGALAGIYRGFKTIFKQAFDQAPSMWDQVAMLSPSTGEEEDYVWLGDFPMMREWLGDRVIKDLTGFSYVIKNKDFESTVAVARNKIKDDKVGIYTPMFQALGQMAKAHRDVLVFALLKAGFSTLCYDGQYMFDSDHPVGEGSVSNYGSGSGTPWYLLDLSRPVKPIILQVRQEPEFVAMDRPDDENAFMRKEFRYGVDDRKNVGFGLWQLAFGSKATLNTDNYSAARSAMMSFTKDDGVTPLGVVPTHLVVPPSEEARGRKVLEAEYETASVTNVWKGTAKLVVVPWLA